MNITQTNKVLSLVSTPETGYVFVHYLQDVNTNETILVDSNIVTSSSEYTLTVDSYFQIVEIKLPTSSGAGYYVTGQDIFNSSDEELTVEELLAIDPSGTNIVREDLDWISTYYLDEYYLNLLKSKYLNNICNCGCISKTDKLMIDTLIMGTTLIDLLVTEEQYYEANRIITQLSRCANLSIETNCNCYG